MFPKFLETALPYALGGLLLISLSELAAPSKRPGTVQPQPETRAAQKAHEELAVQARPSSFQLARAAVRGSETPALRKGSAVARKVEPRARTRFKAAL